MGALSRLVNASLLGALLQGVTTPCFAEQTRATEQDEAAFVSVRVQLRDTWHWTEATSAPLGAPNLWRDVLVVRWSLPTGLFMQASVIDGVRFGFGPQLATGLSGRRFGLRYRWDRVAVLTRF